MSQSKLETINDTIRSLKSLGLPVPYDLIQEKEREENLISDQRIQSAFLDLEKKADFYFNGLNYSIDIQIHYDPKNGVSLTHSEKSNVNHSQIIEDEYRKLNEKYSTAIVVYKNGFIKRNNVLSSEIDSNAVCTLDYNRGNTLLLISEDGVLFGIPKVILEKNPKDKLVSPPQFKNTIVAAFMCQGTETIEIKSSNLTQETNINEFFRKNVNSGTGLYGPHKISTHVDSARIV